MKVCTNMWVKHRSEWLKKRGGGSAESSMWWVYVWVRKGERQSSRERKSSRESFSRRESNRAKNSICNIEGGAAWKTHESSRKYCRSAVHERASLTSGNATVWSQCYATCSLPSYCQGHGSERGEWKWEGADGCKAEGWLGVKCSSHWMYYTRQSHMGLKWGWKWGRCFELAIANWDFFIGVFPLN